MNVTPPPQVNIEQLVEAAKTEAKLEASINKSEHIECFLETVGSPYIEYTPWVMDFHHEYLNFNDNTADSFYLILQLNGQMVGLQPIVIQNYPQHPTLGSNSGALLPPFLSPKLTRKQQRKLLTKCLAFMGVLARCLNINNLRSEFIFVPGETEAWYSLLQEQGATAKFSQELFCDLTIGNERYSQLIRDKYRSHIRKAEQLWDIQVQSQVDDETFERFEQFHIEVAGHRTRSHQTWQIHRQAVKNRQAFCVFAFDNAQQMIGAALYSHTNERAVYSVGVYDRSLFRQPISHAVHYQAILEMKRRGLSVYHLGSRCHSSEWMKPTEKESQIGHFKEGFATDSLFKLTMDWQLEPTLTSGQ